MVLTVAEGVPCNQHESEQNPMMNCDVFGWPDSALFIFGSPLYREEDSNLNRGHLLGLSRRGRMESQLCNTRCVQVYPALSRMNHATQEHPKPVRRSEPVVLLAEPNDVLVVTADSDHHA